MTREEYNTKWMNREPGQFDNMLWELARKLIADQKEMNAQLDQDEEPDPDTGKKRDTVNDHEYVACCIDTWLRDDLHDRLMDCVCIELGVPCNN